METTKGSQAPSINTRTDGGSLSLDYPPSRDGDGIGDSAPSGPLHGYESSPCTNEAVLETQPPKK